MKKKTKADAKKLERLIMKLQENCVLVEGKRDKLAMQKLGCEDVIAVSGRTRQLRDVIKCEKVIIATDLDRKGNELARRVREEMEGLIKVDSETRIHLAKLLELKYFEDIKRKYDEFYEKYKR